MRKKKRKAKLEGGFPLRALLKLKGWSQRKLSGSTGISPRRLCDLAAGRHSPTWRTVLLICTTLGVDLGEVSFVLEGAA